MQRDAPMLLFDRLVDEDPSIRREVRPRRTLDRRGVLASVRRELSHLLNTRLPIEASRLDQRPRTVIDYGIPDFGTYWPRSPEDRQRLGRVLARAVTAFEPRLEGVRVSFDDARDPRVLVGRIEGVLVVGQARESVSFATVINSEAGEVTLDGA